MSRILIHPSSLGRIMGNAKSIDTKFLTPALLAISKKKTKTDEEKAMLAPLLNKTLSEGAKTYLRSLARQSIYGYRPDLDVKYLRKGLALEGDAIALLNRVFLERYEKHVGRVETDLFTGECDILPPGVDYLRDTKVAWSLETFPCIAEDAHDDDYEWQVRAYMNIYDRQRAFVDFCMLTTPDDIRGYESPNIHDVSHIEDERMLVTSVMYERDMEIEALMLDKCRQAIKYIEQIKGRIIVEHDI